MHLRPGRGGLQKHRTLLSGVYTSLYKRMKSSINTQLYTEPDPSPGWPAEPSGRDRGRRGRSMPPLGQMRVEGAAWETSPMDQSW